MTSIPATLIMLLQGCSAKWSPVDYDGDGQSGLLGDCDDDDPSINSNAEELCDEVDNDCDGNVDEGLDQFYADEDGDGFGDENPSSCEQLPGYVEVSGDCDDNDAGAHPNADEYCDDVDNDCDGLVDEGAVDAVSWYLDNDGDGWGVSETEGSEVVLACTQPEGYAKDDGDCDDESADYHPGAAEYDCTDPNDYNCDGSVGYADNDGDGYAACEECDDTNPDISPDADEYCDGQDNDCDDAVDEEALDDSVWYLDGDGDGYGDNDTIIEACEQPEGYVKDDGDCDDEDSAFNPGAAEDDCADPNDYNCDGSVAYMDDDGDGWAACEECNDSNSEVNPDAEEVAGDGIDNDCDASTLGVSGELVTGDLDGFVYSPVTGASTGWSIDLIEDVSGDGRVDLVIGGYRVDEGGDGVREGAVWGVSGYGGGDYDLSDSSDYVFKLTGSGGEEFGFSVCGGEDISGNGLNDILVGATAYDGYTGAAYLFEGSVSGTILDTSGILEAGLLSGDRYGNNCAVIGDVDGDGISDYAVGSWFGDEGGSDSGSVTIIQSTTGEWILSGEAGGDLAGKQVRRVGDINGDGLEELGVSGPLNDGSASNAGAVYLISLAGTSTGSGSLSGESLLVLRGEGSGDLLNSVSGGDVDGDGINEVLVGGEGSSVGGVSSGGAVYLYWGGSSVGGDVTLGVSNSYRVLGEEVNGYLGGSVRLADINGGGQADLVMGAYGEDNGGTDRGSVYVRYGEGIASGGLGSTNASDSDFKISGEADNEQLGITLTKGKDTDGDGLEDIGIGTVSENAVYMFLGVGE